MYHVHRMHMILLIQIIWSTNKQPPKTRPRRKNGAEGVSKRTQSSPFDALSDMEFCMVIPFPVDFNYFFGPIFVSTCLSGQWVCACMHVCTCVFAYVYMCILAYAYVWVCACVCRCVFELGTSGGQGKANESQTSHRVRAMGQEGQSQMLAHPALRWHRKAYLPLPAMVGQEAKQTLTAPVMKNLSWQFFTGSIDLSTGQ